MQLTESCFERVIDQYVRPIIDNNGQTLDVRELKSL